jgi:hypothetical protein
MTDGQIGWTDLSALAPALRPDEALSSWIARIADAHLVTLDELQQELGFPIGALDRGEWPPIKRLAAMTGVREGVLSSRVPVDLLTHPMRPGPNPPHSWAVCEKCLAQDVEAGRPAYIRQSWTHPLATVCHLHEESLVPHGNSRIKIACRLTLFGEGTEANEPTDALLGTVRFDDPAALARARRVVSARGSPRERLQLRWAVRDIVDALATARGQANGGSLMSLFEEPLFGRPSKPGSPQIQVNWWDILDAATRLLYVRVALFILAEPRDPILDDRIWPLGDDWLSSRYRHSRVLGWQASFSHAVQDPLILVRSELPLRAVRQLDERSLGWPKDLRRRWGYVTAAAAVGGFVF